MGMLGVLANIATVAQLSGVHAVMLIMLASRLLRLLQCKTECARLEECVQKLDALLQWPVPTGRVVAKLQLMAIASEALLEAAGLVGSYRRSTLWCRIRTGTSMEARLRGMQDRVNCLCMLVLCVHANLITEHPASDTNTTNHYMISNPLHGEETCDSASDSQRYNGTGQGGADDQSDNTEPGGLDSV